MAQEKTDAELLAEFARLLAEAENGIDNRVAGMALMETIGARGREYLSGTRPDEVAELRAANATLSARVAELEAEVQALRNGGEPVGPRPFVLNPDGKDRKYWAGTTDLVATFPKPAPGAEGGE